MRLVYFIFISLILNACDFTEPAENDLVDLTKPITLYNVFNTNPFIEELPSRNLVNKQIEWSYDGTIFRIALESIITKSYGLPLGGAVPIFEGLHKSYDLFLESKEYIEFSNIDSLASLIDISIENQHFGDLEKYYPGNDYYDEENPLEPQVVEIQVKQLGEDSYHKIEDVNELLGLEFSFRVRLFLRISSGINLNTRSNYVINDQVVTIDDFIPNKAIYRVKFLIQGYYL
ncbi:MAG: hypothetical protein KDD94_14665 [Calditrichaeota bacterium]|nr:hypothetical protein [Calditrichota bacterium]